LLPEILTWLEKDEAARAHYMQFLILLAAYDKLNVPQQVPVVPAGTTGKNETVKHL